MTTLPEEAVKAAVDAYQEEAKKEINHFPDMMRAALTAALPFLSVQGAVKKLEDAALSESVNSYAANYEFRGDSGDYTPTDGERVMIEDAIEGFLSNFLAVFEPSAARKELMKQIREGTAYGFLNDGSQPEGNPDLDCPYCCGSGHKGDIQPSAARSQALEEAAQAAENAMLEYNLSECAGLADWAAFEAGQESGLAHAAAAIRSLSSPDHADAGKVEGDGRADLERFWRPISEADKSITFEHTFDLGDGEKMTIRNSDHYWVRDADGRVYEATWSDHKAGYWWDLQGESPVDPVEYMPHPLSLPTRPSGEVA